MRIRECVYFIIKIVVLDCQTLSEHRVYLCVVGRAPCVVWSSIRWEECFKPLEKHLVGARLISQTLTEHSDSEVSVSRCKEKQEEAA